MRFRCWKRELVWPLFILCLIRQAVNEWSASIMDAEKKSYIPSNIDSLAFLDVIAPPTATAGTETSLRCERYDFQAPGIRNKEGLALFF